MENISYLSIGSNMGDRLHHFKKAIDYIQGDENIRISNISSIYETEPVGYTEQAKFLNAVLKIENSYEPGELLLKCQETEKINGRIRDVRWGPRTIDLDILLYNYENIETESLSVPHPRMLERAFVLIPLLELDPNITLPEMDIPLVNILENIQDREGVRLWKLKSGEDGLGLLES